MKKRIINAVLILCAVSLVVIVAAVVRLEIKGNETEPQQQVQINAQDYLTLYGTKKATEKEDALWLIENYDVVFDVQDARFVNAVNEIDSYFFDTVYLRATAFYKQKNETADYAAASEKLKAVIDAFKQKGKKCAVVFDKSFLTMDFLPVISLCDSVLVSGLEKESADTINTFLASFKKLVADEDIVAEIQLMLSSHYAEKENIDFSLTDSVYLAVTGENEAYLLKQWAELMKDTTSSITAGFYFIDGNNSSDVLKLVYDTDSLEGVSSRCFSSLSAVMSNKGNCFGAVSEYIVNGIIPEFVFRKLSVVGYEGESVEAEESTVEITLTGSNLFPIIYDGKEYYADSAGSKKITLQLDEGENVFRFVQDGQAVLYKANYTFKGELIESVFPKDEISVSPGEEIEVMIIAYSKSEVTVKLGTQQFVAQPEEKKIPCYTAFTAKIKMPSSLEELSSVGVLTVVATHNGNSVQKKGAVIKAFEAATQVSTTTNIIVGTTATQTTYPIENYVPEIPQNSVTTHTNVVDTTTTAFVVPENIKNENLPKSKAIAVISSAYADTWRLVSDDDTFVPYYTPLCQGTMDYITGESKVYNIEDEQDFYYYELASGRKVRQENVQIVSAGTLNSNKMQVLSTENENGNLKIKIKTDWKVPYNIDYSPQNYFSAYGKMFNVSSFTADKIEFTFYHTVSAQGAVDVSSSNVVSFASWSASSSSETAKLTLALKKQGEYYGSSINYDSAGNMIITVKGKPESLQGTVVMLDAGHGGSEPGAVGIGSTVLEKDVNLAIAHQAKIALEEMGATVIMTRYANETLTLEQRKAIMRQYNPDLFVAIHSNGSYNVEEKGTSTYYFKPFSRNLADNIYQELLSVYKNNVYQGRVELYDEISDGTIYYPFSVTRVEECPSILIEVGYMTNDEECYELIDSENQKLFGKAIANGVKRTILK